MNLYNHFLERWFILHMLFTTQHKDKGNDFNFPIVNFPFSYINSPTLHVPSHIFPRWYNIPTFVFLGFPWHRVAANMTATEPMVPCTKVDIITLKVSQSPFILGCHKWPRISCIFHSRTVLLITFHRIVCKIITTDAASGAGIVHPIHYRFLMDAKYC